MLVKTIVSNWDKFKIMLMILVLKKERTVLIA